MNADDIVTCPWCEREQMVHDALLGALGTTAHFRCRGCGGDFSKTVPTEEATDATDDESDS